jgi:uncharacterized membrane protein
MHGLSNLLAGSVAFVGSHFALSHPLRPALVARLGEPRFTILYSVVAAITLTWFVLAAIAAPAAPLWWIAAPGIWDLATLVMLVAAILLAGSLVGNPALVDPTLHPNIPASPRGVLAVTRHPMMWAFTLWAIVHVVLWGSAANLIVAAAIGILAFFGARAQDGKKLRLLGPAWQGWEAKTSFWPFGAQLSGRSPWRATVPHVAILGGGIAIWLIATGAHQWAGGPVAGPWRWLGHYG